MQQSKIEIVIPIPMPTWNVLLGKDRMVQAEIRRLLHHAAKLSLYHGEDWPEFIEYTECRKDAKPIVYPRSVFREMCIDSIRTGEKRHKAVLEAKAKARKAKHEPTPVDIERVCMPGRYSIHFTHYRKNLVDWGNLSVKAIEDALVNEGVVPSDSPKHAANWSFEQKKTKGDERTVVLISSVSTGTSECESERFQGEIAWK